MLFTNSDGRPSSSSTPTYSRLALTLDEGSSTGATGPSTEVTTRKRTRREKPKGPRAPRRREELAASTSAQTGGYSRRQRQRRGRQESEQGSQEVGRGFGATSSTSSSSPFIGLGVDLATRTYGHVDGRDFEGASGICVGAHGRESEARQVGENVTVVDEDELGVSDVTGTSRTRKRARGTSELGLELEPVLDTSLPNGERTQNEDGEKSTKAVTREQYPALLSPFGVSSEERNGLGLEERLQQESASRSLSLTPLITDLVRPTNSPTRLLPLLSADVHVDTRASVDEDEEIATPSSMPDLIPVSPSHDLLDREDVLLEILDLYAHDRRDNRGRGQGRGPMEDNLTDMDSDAEFDLLFRRGALDRSDFGEEEEEEGAENWEFGPEPVTREEIYARIRNAEDEDLVGEEEEAKINELWAEVGRNRVLESEDESGSEQDGEVARRKRRKTKSRNGRGKAIISTRSETDTESDSSVKTQSYTSSLLRRFTGGICATPLHYASLLSALQDQLSARVMSRGSTSWYMPLPLSPSPNPDLLDLFDSLDAAEDLEEGDRLMTGFEDWFSRREGRRGRRAMLPRQTGRRGRGGRSNVSTRTVPMGPWREEMIEDMESFLNLESPGMDAMSNGQQ